MKTYSDSEITIRAKAFSGHGIASHRVIVATDGTVRVYDPIADHFTTCHSLSKSAQDKARKLASGDAQFERLAQDGTLSSEWDRQISGGQINPV